MSWPKMPTRPLWMPNRRVISENSVLLPGAVEAEQGGKARRLHVEGDVDQRTPLPIGMTDAVDRQRRHRRRF
ncbi:hypothetical protein ABH991_003592 [Bradyrhizobium ottawaense]